MNKGEFDATAILSVKAKQEIIEKTNVTKLKKKYVPRIYTECCYEIGAYFLFHEEHSFS